VTDARASALERSLRGVGELAQGDRVAEVRRLAGGWSRHSYAAVVADAGGGERRYIVRVKPDGALLDTDLRLEHEIFRRLNDEPIATPRVFCLQEDDPAFGGPYLVMEHLPGVAPTTFQRRDWAWLEDDWRNGRTIAGDLVGNLARIHALPVAQLADTVPELRFADVVARWRGVYERQGLVRDPVFEEAYDWLAAHEPDDEWHGLVHGDYRIGNALVAEGRITAILDWELAYRGDVRFDLGYLALARLAGKHLRRRSPLFGLVAEEEWFLRRYGELSGRTVDREALRPFEMLAMAMLLATQLTAVWMYREGRTTDMRMAWSRFSLAGLRQDMAEVMGW
jgi:aminoglycoside phosphotransferase (APT) family kinase protein